MARHRWDPRLVAAGAVVAMLCLGSQPGAQDRTPDDVFNQRIAEAKKADAERRSDVAAADYQSLLDLARREHAEIWEGRALIGLGTVAYHTGHYADARARLLDGLDIVERLHATNEVGIASNLLGIVAYSTGDLAEAVKRYDHAAEAFARTDNTRSRLGALYNSLLAAPRGPVSDLEPRILGLLNAAHTAGDRAVEADTLHLWGDRLFLAGDYESAIEKLEQAAALLTGSDVDPAELGTIYNSLGRVYRLHGRPAAALEYQLKALAILEVHGTMSGRVQGLNAVAVAYQANGNDVQAKVRFEQALALAEGTGAASLIGFARGSYGTFLAENGEPARGRALIEQSLADTNSGVLPYRYNALAIADLELGRPHDALADTQRVLDDCKSDSDYQCLLARLHRAQADLALGDDAAALAEQEQALRRVESIRERLAASDFLRQGFQELTVPWYSIAIELNIRRGDVRDALNSAELGRSRALLDLLASHQQSRSSSPMTWRGPRPDDLRSTTAAEAATAGDLTALADRMKSTLLLYWVSDTKIFMWVVQPGGAIKSAVTAVPIKKLTALVDQTAAFAESGARGGASAATRGAQAIPLAVTQSGAWTDLYDLLIRPIEASLPKTAGAPLMIVPHGPLMNVAFAALRDARSHYLVERYAVDAVPAIGMLQYTSAAQPVPARLGPMLLVADPSQLPRIHGEAPMPPLPGAVEEVRAIAALVPASRTTTLANATATESRVLAAAPHQAVIHLATHAVVNDMNPLASYLALGRPADGSASGMLTAEKIYQLNLDADLVVLSACRSGGGVTNGDGIATLARAFFYAGARSLIVSLWDVADEPTNRLLPVFYREWLHGAGKAQALRTAQLKLIDDLRAGRVKVTTPVGDVVMPEHPAFWAGFVLLGEPN